MLWGKARSIIVSREGPVIVSKGVLACMMIEGFRVPRVLITTSLPSIFSAMDEGVWLMKVVEIPSRTFHFPLDSRNKTLDTRNCTQ